MGKQFLTQKCDKVHHPECWDLNMPGLVSYAEVLYASEADDSEEDAEESGVENEEEDEQEVEKAHESFVEVMEDVVDEVEDAFDGDDEALSDDSRTSSNERSHSSHHHHRDDDDEDEEEDEDEDEDEDESGSRSDLQAKGKEVIGMLENPATTPSDLLLLRKELELLEKENALLTVKEKAARLGVEV